MRPTISFLSVLASFIATLTAYAVDDPIVLTPTADLAIYSGNSGDPWAGEATNKTMDIMTSKPDDKRRNLISFEFTKEAETPCTTAILRLHADEVWPNKNKAYIRVHRLMRPFSQTGASWGHASETSNWINPGGDFDPAAICTRKLGKESGKNQTIDIDITPLVRLWQSKQSKNFGMLLAVDDGSDSYVRFHTKNASEAERPKLMLYYAATPPKVSEMKAEALAPLGKMPDFKLEVLSAKSFDAVADKELKLAMVVRGGLAPYAWKFTGLPAGLTSTPQGLVSGVVKVGKFTFSATVSDSDNRTATVPLTLNVTEAKEATPPTVAKPVAKAKASDED